MKLRRALRECSLVPRKRRLPHAVPAIVPRAALEMRRRVGPHERHAFVPGRGIDGAERRAEGVAVREARREVRDVRVRLGTVDAAVEAAVEVDVARAEEPWARGNYNVVETRDLVGPRVVELVEV